MVHSNDFFLVSAFTNKLFSGNPTPVCFLEREWSTRDMKMFAKELQKAVTVFVYRSNDNGIYLIRYFTSTDEIPACGHGTLAAAAILFEKEENQPPVTFKTIEDVFLIVTKHDQMVLMEYPIYTPVSFTAPSSLFKALKINSCLSEFYCKELKSLFIEVEKEEEVKGLTPDFMELKNSSNQIKEVVVMSRSKHTYDFILRAFCPWIGIDEDPVTGSIYSVLGPYWKQRLGKSHFLAYQASDRGGQIKISLLEDSVIIGGECRIVIEGRLKI